MVIKRSALRKRPVKKVTPVLKAKPVVKILTMQEAGALTKNQVIAILAQSTHGELKPYVPIISTFARQDPDFTGHLISWNERNGEYRDSKVALPVASLIDKDFAKMEPYAENSYTHLALLDPRLLLQGIRFSRELGIGGRRRKRLFLLAELYLREREANYGWWESMAVQHRNSVKSLYALCHVKPIDYADKILFKGEFPRNSKFEAIRNLCNMSPREAAATIMEKDIPSQIALGALGAKAKDTDLVMALIGSMSPAELINSTSTLEKMGIKENPALRAAYEDGLKKVATSKKVSTFKTTRAIESMGDVGAGSIKEKLKAVQEKQIDTLGGVEGNWVVLVDKSGSMQIAIETGRLIAGALARMVKGEVHLIFFDETPRYKNVTGKTYEEIQRETVGVVANGGTGIGCGLQYLLDKGIDIDGIAIVSDGGENRLPYFGQAYTKYCPKFGKEPPVYFYKLSGDPDVLSINMKGNGLDMNTFDLRNMRIDYYSLANLVKTMNTRRYGLVDQVLDTPLLTMKDVLKTQAEHWV